MKHLKAKWTRKDGWKAKQFVCNHSAGLINLTLYYEPQKVIRLSNAPKEHKGYTMDQGL